MEITLNSIKYKVVKNYREGFDKESIEARATDYFNNFDYIFGDWAYGKLRLKGFNKNDNKNANKINNIDNLENYISTNCAYDCKYFLLEKMENKKKREVIKDE